MIVTVAVPADSTLDCEVEVTVTVGASSLSVIVIVPVLSEIVALVGLESVLVIVSSFSSKVSFVIVMLYVFVPVSSAAQVNVPVASVKSVPSTAVPVEVV